MIWPNVHWLSSSLIRFRLIICSSEMMIEMEKAVRIITCMISRVQLVFLGSDLGPPRSKRTSAVYIVD